MAVELGDPVYRQAVEDLRAALSEESPTGRYMVLAREYREEGPALESVHGDPTGKDAAIDVAAGMMSDCADEFLVVPWIQVRT